MKKHTMYLVLALAMMFAYASAKAQTGGQDPNSPANRAETGTQTTQSQQVANPPKPTPPPSQNTAKVGDSQLQTAVKDKLAADPAFANVQAAVENGRVTLDGSVNSNDDKKKAKDAVKSVAGVRTVKEHLKLSGKEGKNQPQSSSAAGPGMSFLSAQDAAQGNASQNTAGSIAGNSQTSANPSSAAPQTKAPEAGTMSQSGSSPTGRGDTLTLQKQIETSIKNEPSLTDSTVNVNVSDNAIELNGTVGSNKAKTQAERIAQSYAQNRKVNNNLQVTGAGNSDLNNGHSAMSNGQPSTPSNATTPKGNSPDMPRDPNSPQQDKGDQNQSTPR
ncbi:Putative phosphoslipid binding protein [Candidatus Koribacter versatilis Ellin345]|uniref:Phosphoslipid binding protein n=1 Tax=Koribacter versatilis (strain Ellin345) TaxID=204669 RepID=Q1II23_KORVE|nr:BON domain-containing protein [Candidatus Koribacter versatilis]ABF43477.1 Putative phosphoslipid binding protein [Candidatus Koribacter versatilis Ellin345]